MRAKGQLRSEFELATPQGAEITLTDGTKLLNLCSNNYLGMGNNPEVIEAAHGALDRYGYGVAAGRMLCGTQDVHRRLQRVIADFVGLEDALLYNSCYDANGGLFEVLTGENDAIISDALNHASIIDGVRLSKAKRYRYASCDMDELEQSLKKADAECSGIKLIITDGVFSMDGLVAPLDNICDLADKYDALVAVDDSHGTGVVGATGRGSHEHCGVMDRVDIITGTLGKAIGGAAGGFTAARACVVEKLRQTSRTYIFSNAVPPSIAAGAIKAFELAGEGGNARTALLEKTSYFRAGMRAAGFTIGGEGHPIVPVMTGADDVTFGLFKEVFANGLLVIPMTFPVVPRGQGRIRVQISAVHETTHLDRAIEIFTEAGRKTGVI
nr:glycine C-acetyltransferase [Shimia biformata]